MTPRAKEDEGDGEEAIATYKMAIQADSGKAESYYNIDLI